jgi:hypothetical protein
MKFDLPKRMPLLRPPAGVAVGAARESLHSVIKRVCVKNRLSVSVVVAHVLNSTGHCRYSAIRLANNSMHLISRGENTTSQWIAAMEATVDIPDLWKHTLRDVVCLNGVGAATCAHWRRWCPDCYEEDVGTDVGPYDRLLWSVSNVRVCERHRTLLCSVCAHCGRSELPVLAGLDIPGFCPICHGWLGGKGARLPDGRDQYAEYLLWTARSFSDLLDAELLTANMPDQILEMLMRLRDRYCNGLDVILAKTLGRNKSVIATWFSRKASPSWNALCDISFVFHVPLIDLFSTNETAIDMAVVRALPLQISVRGKRRHGRQLDLVKVLSLYAAIHNGECTFVRTLADVGRHLGVEPKDLRRALLFQTEAIAAALKDRAKNFRERQAAARLDALKNETILVVTEMARRAERPTRRSVDRALSRAGLVVLRSDARFVRAVVQDTARMLAD